MFVVSVKLWDCTRHFKIIIISKILMIKKLTIRK